MSLGRVFRRLRTLLPILGGIQLVGILVTVIALVALSNWLDDANQRITHAMEGAERGYRFQLAVLRERQELLVWALTTDPVHLHGSMSRMDQASRLLHELDVDLEIEGDAPLLDRARQALYGYREAELRAQIDGSGGSLTPGEIWELYRQTLDPLDEFLAATDALLAFYLAHAEAVQTEADEMNYLATVGSPVVSVLLVGVTVLFLWRLFTLVAQPLPQIQATMARLRQGDLSARSPPFGLEEYDNIVGAINALASELQAQRSSRLAFFAAVAHDLRNPMNAMKLAMARIRPGRPLPREEDLRHLATVVIRQLDVQERLVGDLLDQAQIESGEIALDRTDVPLGPLCESVVELLGPTAPSHRLELVVSEPIRVIGDSRRLEQMLVNLIGNAIKYSPGGGRVQIRIADRDEQAEIVVSDEGIGIAAADLPELFEPFRRSPRVVDIPGSGLGLSAVRRIIEAHGGTITVESAVGRGSSFRVRLPSVSERSGAVPLTH